MKRARKSGIKLSARDAAIIKAMLKRGDRQHDIAAYFDVNAGQIAEIANGHKFPYVMPADDTDLPPSGAPGPILRKILAELKAKYPSDKMFSQLFITFILIRIFFN